MFIVNIRDNVIDHYNVAILVYSIPIFFIPHLLQDLTLEQRVEMPTCNLAKTMHDK
jgi:hypothetical protein